MKFFSKASLLIAKSSTYFFWIVFGGYLLVLLGRHVEIVPSQVSETVLRIYLISLPILFSLLIVSACFALVFKVQEIRVADTFSQKAKEVILILFVLLVIILISNVIYSALTPDMGVRSAIGIKSGPWG